MTKATVQTAMGPPLGLMIHTCKKERTDRAARCRPGYTDAALLALLEYQPQRAWELLLDKHADTMFTCLRRLGFDYDESMDRFVYVCEKLSEQDFRRLRGVKFLGDSGELTPWLVQVVRNLAINWAQSRQGRRRLLKPIARLGRLDQKVFEAYFWRGRRPSDICESLRADGHAEIHLADVLDSLERLFDRLTPNKLWRLVSGLAKSRAPISLTDGEEDGCLERSLPSEVENPEEKLLRGERRRRLRAALAELPAADRLLLQLRYEEGLTMKEATRLLRISEKKAASTLRTVRRRLRRGLVGAGAARR